MRSSIEMETRVKPVCHCGSVIDPAGNDPWGRPVFPSMCARCVAEVAAENETRRRRERRAGLIERANLPAAAWEFDLESARKTGRPGFWTATGWSFQRNGLYLHGEPGTGKTLAAWLVLRREMVDGGRGGLFLHMPTFLDELRDRTLVGRQWKERAKDVAVLVLDDIGAETPWPSAREVLLVIIDHRITARRPTIFTSNLRPSDLFETLGADVQARRITDRIVGSCEIVRFEGESFRVEAGRGLRGDGE